MQTRVHVDIYERVRQGDGWKVWNLNTESSLCAGSWVGLCQHMMKSTRSCRKWREENPFKLIKLFPSLTVWMTEHVLVSKCNNKQGNEKNSNLIHQTEKHWIIHTEPLAVLLIMFNCISEGISKVALSTRSSQTRADVPDKLCFADTALQKLIQANFKLHPGITSSLECIPLFPGVLKHHPALPTRAPRALMRSAFTYVCAAGPDLLVWHSLSSPCALLLVSPPI